MLPGSNTAGKFNIHFFIKKTSDNPRPINVSQARANLKDTKIHIFIELNDKGYPGAIYNLTYNENHDTLAGLYYQPIVGQTFEVIFVKEQ